MKYFYSQNAGRLIAGQRFHLYEIVGGSACGVFCTEEKEVEAVLASLAADPKSPVQEISQADYDACIKKNPPQFNNWSPSAVSSPSIALPQSGTAIKGTGVVAVSASSEATVPVVAEEAPVEIAAQVETTEDALKLGTVLPAEGSAPAVTEEKPKHKINWDHKTKKKK